MNILNLYIQDFKCFREASFELNNLTVMTGANSAGKSTIIQALLLMNLASENPMVSLEDHRLALNFGKVDDIINEDADDHVEFRINSSTFSFNGSDSQDGKIISFDVNLNEDVFAQGFKYLSADRIGPRYVTPISSEMEDCGCRGLQTANVINNNAFTKIAENRLYRPSGNFQIQLDEWLGTIFPDISVKIKPSGDTHCQLTVRRNGHSTTSAATNVGYGISYALPILVSCLLAKEGSWIVVENPEAHLHAKAQSNMGFFLGVMAASGLRIIVETHSEHIVNGMRRAVVNPSTSLTHNDINIYYMRAEKEGGIIKIAIDERGNLSDFPVDFFDQGRQDMMDIIQTVQGYGQHPNY